MVQEERPFAIYETEMNACEAHFEICALDAGYAQALGNALRRVLLSSLPGAALTSVQIANVQHEFQDIPEVLEDVADIVFSLKKVRLRCYTDHAVKVQIDVKGPGEVTAGDIVGPETVEIVNPDLHLATLDNERAHLKMDLVVENGRGFVTADEQAARTMEAPPIGVILLDALYSPVRKVNMSVKPQYRDRGYQTDSVLLEITTDGTISPAEALRESAQVLERQFGVFADYQHKEGTEEWKRSTSSNVVIPPHIYNTSIEDVQFSARAFNCLRRAGITKVGLVLEMDRADLLGIRNVGEKIVEEITERLLRLHYLPEQETSATSIG
jgi:DNA-directed RNA polymerase subunit alpha